MKPIHLIMHEPLLRGRQLGLVPCKATTLTDNHHWKDQLLHLDAEIGDVERPLVFASIQACNFILKNCPNLSRGVFVNFEKCAFANSINYIPRDMRLNQSFIILPFGEVRCRKTQIQQIFGDQIFIRPNASTKSFTGQSVAMENFEKEMHFFSQALHVSQDELCVIDKHQDFRRTEFRAWVVEGKVASIAPYSFYGPTRQLPSPELHEMAANLATHLELFDSATVVDFCVLGNGEPRVVEINGLSTSGLYQGADIPAIVELMDNTLY